MSQLISYGAGVYAFDAEYVRPGLAAIHMIVEDGRVAFVDTGCNSSLPNVLSALATLDLSAESVDLVMLSHIHLDHAGGAGVMMRQFPNARLLVHPRGARHMIDPSKLIEGTIGVYGEEATRELYGDILPVDPLRIIEASHELVVRLAGREFLCLDTPGHAKHHIAIVDRKTGHIFSGDDFGVSYRQLDVDGRQFVFPTTTPVQFDPVAMHATIHLLAGFRPEAIYLTHFGQITDIPSRAADLHRMVDAFVAIARRHRHAGQGRHASIRADLCALLLDELQRFGSTMPERELLALFENDLELNAQGIAIWVDSTD